MGGTAIIYAGVALVVGLVCLIAGFFWGRSNLNAKVQQAVEEGAAALDAREFAMRRQLDEAVAEVARLRPLAEDLGRVQERLKVEQAEYDHLKADFVATMKTGSADLPDEQEAPAPKPVQPSAPESADEAIQKLLKSLEVTMKESEAQPEVPPEPPQAIEEPQPVIAKQPPVKNVKPEAAVSEPPRSVSEPPRAASEPPRSASEPPKAVSEPPRAASEPPKREPAIPQAREPKPAVVDEWQEFARSLADLTRRNP